MEIAILLQAEHNFCFVWVAEKESKGKYPPFTLTALKHVILQFESDFLMVN